MEEGEGIGKGKVIKEENLSHEEWVSLAILRRYHVDQRVRRALCHDV